MLCTFPLHVLAPHLCSMSQVFSSPFRRIVLHIGSKTTCQSSLYSCKERHKQRSQRLGKASENEIQHVRNFSLAQADMFWEKDAKGGYKTTKKQSTTQLIRDGLKELRCEVAKWQEEMREKFSDDFILVRPGDMDKKWLFKTDEDLEQWIVTSDKDHKQGLSSGGLTISTAGHGLFSGEINTVAPKDGKVKRAGYVNMKSLRCRKSFKREDYMDWFQYTTLEMRVRGDGRNYILNISTPGYFDVTWNDVYSYVLYTRGGPHWQITRIPFSKFFLNSKGRVQDKQSPINLTEVVSFGISAGDRVNAPFRLEIDYIGLYRDFDHDEESAYETYVLPNKFYI